ncbi:MAG: hypothetical protein JJU28_22610 [Cyclobacteriaceae bacterium]|nr:hypothetical protein [Cyclobacteriaceae bacterium]
MNIHNAIYLLIAAFFQVLFTLPLNAQASLRIGSVQCLVSTEIPSPQRETLQRMLSEEIAKRSRVSFSTNEHWRGKGMVFAFALAGDKELFGEEVPHRTGSVLPEQKAEGYRIWHTRSNQREVIWIIAADARGALFGAGWLLRNLAMERQAMHLEIPLDYATSPDYSIRGHQIGYRSIANTYDAWSVQQYEQYIRELVIFGGNSIENIPIDDDNQRSISEHMQIKPVEMNRKMSEICQAYDVDYWAWTPATFDLLDQAKRAEELERHEQFYASCPRLNHIFFPGGDPGNNHPREVMPYLKDLHTRLIKYHPEAGIWISLQGFSVEQVDYFYRYLEEHKPEWLMGVVSGPSSPSIAETRFRLPKDYRHRHYADITHTVRCDYPVERWDQAFALTLGREPVNPQPYYYARIHKRYAPFTDGFVTYSDGSTDDVNKMIWNMRGWDTEKSVEEILEDYANFFFGKELSKSAASGILALERNWDGPLAANGGVEATFSFWQNLEKQFPALRQNNWRWQMLLMRAYYDVYTRRRLLYEEGLEKKANAILLQAGELGAQESMQMALQIVKQADEKPVDPQLRQNIEELFALLFKSIGLQSSVPKFGASGSQRGASLDFVDYPLNNRWWLEDQFTEIARLAGEEEKLARLKAIALWENPGQGSFYDDISHVRRGPRVSSTSYDATDVAWWNDGLSRERLSFQLFQRSPVIEYDNLDPGARYHIRVCGSGDALIRVDGVRLQPIVYNKETGTFKEWIVPLEISRKGKIKVTFDVPEESHINWRQYSKISDIWLLKQ